MRTSSRGWVWMVLAGAAMLALACPRPAGAQGRPAPPPYEVLPPHAHAGRLLERMGERTSAVWLEDDVLTFAHVRKDGPVELTGGIQRPMERVPGSDVWVARLRWEGWARAQVAYAFIGPGHEGRVDFEVWRGPDAPEPPAKDAPIGAVETVTLASRALGEERRVTVVMPAGVEPGTPVPAVVLADGQGAEGFARIAASLASRGLCRPVAVIGIHSAGYAGDRSAPYDPEKDMRGRDYLERRDAERFGKHLAWVVDEVLPWARERFGISTRREDLAVAGFSNGGAFAVSAGLRRPAAFGAVIGLSVGVPPEGPKPGGPLPRYRLAAGELEAGFLNNTRATHDKVKAWGADARVEAFAAGHDQSMWELAFSRFLVELFPPDAGR